MRAFARFLARNPSTADDLVQETILRALAKSEQYQEDTNLKAWAFSILRNMFLEQTRRRKKEQEVLECYASDASLQTASQPSGPDRQALHDLDEMLWKISPLLREALVLIGAQGMSYEEAALVCNASVGTMKTRVSRARSELMKLSS
ncbi:sigma-70 family RNA polymerase sigma factor [Acetobacter cibinongensis]|uniref:sigma-70 family RNA polymerase sigma factor n=1 Tax=Acetobacter cibinongensis TaxID=146475 RepID=UPI001F0B2F0E|nr:sigma-70 family RNA polymerase sigma factor [Acetobacter cibinongensis]